MLRTSYQPSCKHLPLTHTLLIYSNQNTFFLFTTHTPSTPTFSLVWKKIQEMTIQTAGERGTKCKSNQGVCLWDCGGQQRIEWEACVCGLVRDMNECPAMSTQRHWPDCWDSCSVDNRERLSSTCVWDTSKTLKHQIHLSSSSHWGNDPAVNTALCWSRRSLWLLRSVFYLVITSKSLLNMSSCRQEV